MSRWIVAIEGQAPLESEPLAKPADLRNRLMGTLADLACEVGVGPRSWSVTIEIDHDVEGEDIRQVSELAYNRVTEATSTAAMPSWPIVRVDATRLDVTEEAPLPVLPEVVGVSEVLKILSISKQYFGQLRTTGRFPDPIFELKESPIWARSAVEAFAATRRPSARTTKAVPNASTVRRIGSQGDLVPKKRGPQLEPIPGGANLRGNFKLRPIVKP